MASTVSAWCRIWLAHLTAKLHSNCDVTHSLHSKRNVTNKFFLRAGERIFRGKKTIYSILLDIFFLLASAKLCTYVPPYLWTLSSTSEYCSHLFTHINSPWEPSLHGKDTASMMKKAGVPHFSASLHYDYQSRSHTHLLFCTPTTLSHTAAATPVYSSRATHLQERHTLQTESEMSGTPHMWNLPLRGKHLFSLHTFYGAFFWSTQFVLHLFPAIFVPNPNEL